jgi:tRNA (guanine37-N1)-methyltransferase
MAMRFDIVTIFPEIFAGPFDFGIVKRAITTGLIQIGVHDLRDYTVDRHRQVDDRPFGGGAGMVMKPEPLFRAVEDINSSRAARVVLLSPQGRLFSQQVARELAGLDRLVLICGRYEGVDERVVENVVDDELSIGDYVLSGGEIPAMVLVDATVRLLPGALGCESSIEQESFSRTGDWQGLLDYPQYTRPANYRGLEVPQVLLNGNHGDIERWRRGKAIEKTLRRRPDLFEAGQPGDSGPEINRVDESAPRTEID